MSRAVDRSRCARGEYCNDGCAREHTSIQLNGKSIPATGFPCDFSSILDVDVGLVISHKFDDIVPDFLLDNDHHFVNSATVLENL